MDFIQKSKSALVWSISARTFAQIFSWLSTLLVIRYVSPESYGIMSMAGVSIAALTLLSTTGFSDSIIQKEKLHDTDISNLLGLYVLIGGSAAAIQFFGAPFIAAYFNNDALITVLRTLSIIYLLIPWTVIPSAILARNMELKKRSLADLVISVIGAAVALGLAINGFEYWALVFQMLVSYSLRAITYCSLARFLRWPGFRIGEIKDMLVFGGIVTATSIMWMFYNKMDIIIGGRVISTENIGIYSVAVTLALMPLSRIAPVINQISLPFYSRFQHDRKAMTYYLTKSVRIGSTISFPIFIGISVLAEEAVHLLFGNKWEDAITPLQILCLIIPFRVTLNLLAPCTKAINKPIANLIVVIFQIITFSLLLLTFSDRGVEGLVLSWCIAAPLYCFVGGYFYLRVLEINPMIIVKAVIPAVLATAIMGGFTYAVKLQLTDFSNISVLVIVAFAGVMSYVLCLRYLFPGNYNDALSLLKKKKV